MRNVHFTDVNTLAILRSNITRYQTKRKGEKVTSLLSLRAHKRKDPFAAQLIIIIKSEVTNFSVWDGCTIIFCQLFHNYNTYTTKSGNAGFSFHYYCTVYDVSR